MTADVEPGERELIRRFREGDEEALRLLLEQCQDVVEQRAGKLMTEAIRRRMSVADVLQDARLIAYQRRATLEYRGPGSFRRWLLGIVDLEARDAVKHHARTAKRAVDREATHGARPETRQFLGPDASPSQYAIRSETEELVRRAMDALPEDYREVVRLARIERLGAEEIAARMGRSVGAVHKLLSRALIEFGERFHRLKGGGDD